MLVSYVCGQAAVTALSNPILQRSLTEFASMYCGNLHLKVYKQELCPSGFLHSTIADLRDGNNVRKPVDNVEVTL
jgi:hypothetical protein